MAVFVSTKAECKVCHQNYHQFVVKGPTYSKMASTSTEQAPDVHMSAHASIANQHSTHKRFTQQISHRGQPLQSQLVHRSYYNFNFK